MRPGERVDPIGLAPEQEGRRRGQLEVARQRLPLELRVAERILSSGPPVLLVCDSGEFESGRHCDLASDPLQAPVSCGAWADAGHGTPLRWRRQGRPPTVRRPGRRRWSRLPRRRSAR